MCMIKQVIIYHFKSFYRLKMTPFIAPPDFLAIILGVAFFCLLALGLASENPILFNNIKIFNYNYLVAYVYLFFLFFLFFDGYISDYYTPNYQYLKLTMP